MSNNDVVHPLLCRRRPSNPDVRCQCTTPQIMDERIEPLLIKIFTANEIEKSFKDKFMKCVKASVEPLQLTDVMKRSWNFFIFVCCRV